MKHDEQQLNDTTNTEDNKTNKQRSQDKPVTTNIKTKSMFHYLNENEVNESQLQKELQNLKSTKDVEQEKKKENKTKKPNMKAFTMRATAHYNARKRH